MNASDRSTAKSDAAIIALLEESTIRSAAIRSGIGEATLRRWLREDTGFKTRYLAARSEVFSQALNQLRQGAIQAVETLRSIIASGEIPPRVRVSAAQVLLNSLLKGMQIEEIEQRLYRPDNNVIVVHFDEQDKDCQYVEG